MTNKFDWARMYKDEEYLEREAYSCVEAALQRHYDIEDITALTQEQWVDIHAWQEENVSEYSPMNMGFSDVYNVWEMENDV
tara:strand:- start:468 stop:710 length:243 start_codon:yes stop_codon:yes gene_type:complete